MGSLDIILVFASAGLFLIACVAIAIRVDHNAAKEHSDPIGPDTEIPHGDYENKDLAGWLEGE